MKRKQIPVHTGDLNNHGVSVKSMEIDVADTELVKAHRDEYYIFLLQQKGALKLMLDFDSVTMKEMSLLFIKPGQVHYYLPPQNSGLILQVRPGVINKDFRDYLDKLATQCISLKDSLRLEKILKLISETTHLPETGKFEIQELHFHTNAFVAAVCGIFSSLEEKSPNPKSRQNQISTEFRQLLKQYFRTQKKPADYAILLNISPSYLNETLVKITGFSTSYWIQQEMFLEAKRLLHHTELTAKEIAFELGFEDHTYFARLFKKVNGITPVEFRKVYRGLSN